MSMSFADVCKEVDALVPSETYTSVEVRRGNSFGQSTIIWRLYHEKFGFTDERRTPEDALDEFKKKLAEQERPSPSAEPVIDPIELPIADPLSRPSELVVPNVPPTQPNAEPVALAVGDIVSIDDTESLFCGQEAEVVHVGETAAAVEINGVHYGYPFGKLRPVRRAPKAEHHETEPAPAPNPGERFGDLEI